MYKAMDIFQSLIFLIFSGLLLTVLVGGDLPCMARQGDEGQGQICVCNSSYCDTIERPVKLGKGQYYWYSTSNSTPGFSHTVGNFASHKRKADIIFKVNSSVHLQEVFGFGGSFTDSAGMVSTSLPQEVWEKVITSYFGEDGIEYSMARVPIGGSAYSPRQYTLDDVPYDEDLSHFSLTYEDYNYKIPLITKAISVSQRGIKFLGSSWSAPSWMKANDANGSGYLKEKYFELFSQYHLRFLEEYKRNNISFWALSGGHEVMINMFISKKYQTVNSTMMLADTQIKWFKSYLSPLLKSSPFSNVKLVTLDDMRLFVKYWMERFSGDPKAMDVVDGISLHWYTDFITLPSVLTDLHNAYPDKPILYTESSIVGEDLPGPILGSWYRAELYIHNIIENFNHWTQCYIDWNLALDLEGGPTLGLRVDAAILVNQTSKEFYKQPIFYGIGHFSKFMAPGSRIIMVESNKNIPYTDQPLLNSQNPNGIPSIKYIPIPPVIVPPVVGFLAAVNPDGTYTVILANFKNEPAHVRIDDHNVGSIRVNLEPHSINSFIYWL